MNDATKRFLRTLIQLAAGGTFTALFEQIAHDVPDGYTPYIVIVATLVVTFAQNALEDAGAIKPLLK